MLPARVFFFARAFRVRTCSAVHAIRFDFLAMFHSSVVNEERLLLEAAINGKTSIERQFIVLLLGWQDWPAPGSEDTELGVLLEPEVAHGEAEVYAGV
jgi:hypothetical protein